MVLPKVTLIVTQRERFSLTELSLNSILADYDSYPFQLIYVDGNSPPHIQKYLQAQADRHDFITLIRREHYLKSNEARNLALPLAKSADYIAFLDNDDVVERGWLKPLVDCAETEQAAIVTPLILQGDPESTDIEIHVAGIDTTFHKRPRGKRWFEQKQLLYGTKLRNLQQELCRTTVDSVEFHCILARRSFMDTAVLDEVFCSLASHTDLCLQATSQGKKVFLEPASRVVFLNPRQITYFDWEDVKFYMFKWDEKGIRAVFKRTQKKWNLAGDDPSFWAIWKWVIGNRHLPLKQATAADSWQQKLAQICYARWCPGWLRMTLEYWLLKVSFPESGAGTRLARPMNFPIEIPVKPQNVAISSALGR